MDDDWYKRLRIAFQDILTRLQLGEEVEEPKLRYVLRWLASPEAAELSDDFQFGIFIGFMLYDKLYGDDHISEYLGDGQWG